MAFIEPYRAGDLPDEFVVRDAASIEFIVSFNKTLNVMTEKYTAEADTSKVLLLTSFLDNGPELLHFRLVFGERRLCDVMATIRPREDAFIPGMDRGAIGRAFPSVGFVLLIEMPAATTLATYGHAIHVSTIEVLQDIFVLATAAVQSQYVGATMIIHAFPGTIDGEDDYDIAVNPSDELAVRHIATEFRFRFMSEAVRVRRHDTVLVDHFTYMFGACASLLSSSSSS